MFETYSLFKKRVNKVAKMAKFKCCICLFHLPIWPYFYAYFRAYSTLFLCLFWPSLFICGCRSTRFRQDLRRQGEGVSWQFIRKEGAGWDRASRCEEQNGDNKVLTKETKPSLRKKPSQKPTPSQSFSQGGTGRRLLSGEMQAIRQFLYDH